MWLTLLERQGTPVGWDELVTGYDFGLLGQVEIQDWILAHGPLGPMALAALEAQELFEGALWKASLEATGKVPRPGGHRWAQAQDRWRLALLRDAMEAPLSAEALAVAVETIYEKVGCPEDMLGLWHRPSPWEKRLGAADRKAIEAFLQERSGVAP